MWLAKKLAKSRAEQRLYLYNFPYDMLWSFADKKQSVLQDPQLWASAAGVKAELGGGGG